MGKVRACCSISGFNFSLFVDCGSKSDVWLTVHHNSVWIRNQLDVTLCYTLFLLYKLLNMFRATVCPSSEGDD